MTSALKWFKSSYSSNDGPDCVEVAIAPQTPQSTYATPRTRSAPNSPSRMPRGPSSWLSRPTDVQPPATHGRRSYAGAVLPVRGRCCGSRAGPGPRRGWRGMRRAAPGWSVRGVAMPTMLAPCRCPGGPCARRSGIARAQVLPRLQGRARIAERPVHSDRVQVDGGRVDGEQASRRGGLRQSAGGAAGFLGHREGLGAVSAAGGGVGQGAEHLRVRGRRRVGPQSGRLYPGSRRQHEALGLLTAILVE